MLQLAGAALIVIGTLVLLNVTNNIDSATIKFVPIVIIVIGCIIFVISFFGCCGAIRESTCMLTTASLLLHYIYKSLQWLLIFQYAIILLLFFILQVAIGVYGFIQVKNNDNKELDKEVTKALDSLFSKYNNDNEAKEAFNDLQRSVSLYLILFSAGPDKRDFATCSSQSATAFRVFMWNIFLILVTMLWC